MKKMIIAAMLLCSTAMLNAQVSVTINIESQPGWGPTGYDEARYYYLPDLNIYYDVEQQAYHYLSGSKWLSSKTLPSRYRNTDLSKMHKVVINDRRDPWSNNREDLKKYSSFRRKNDQPSIRDSKEDKYFESKEHPQHADWEKEHGRKENPKSAHP